MSASALRPKPNDDIVQAVLIMADNRICKDSNFCSTGDANVPVVMDLFTAAWNRKWIEQFPGHKFMFVTGQCQQGRYMAAPDGKTEIKGGWAKVKAAQQAMKEFPSAQYFMFLDSDIIIQQDNFNMSLIDIFDVIQNRFGTDGKHQPFIVNQDANCGWCDIAAESMPHFKHCLNSGTFLWQRNELNEQILDAWLHSSLDDYSVSHTGFYNYQFRTGWPWEQDRLMALVNDKQHPGYSASFRVVPEPESHHMNWTFGQKEPYHKKWCLSHLPSANCILGHYCADDQKKEVVQKIKALSGWSNLCTSAIQDSMYAVL